MSIKPMALLYRWLRWTPKWGERDLYMNIKLGSCCALHVHDAELLHTLWQRYLGQGFDGVLDIRLGKCTRWFDGILFELRKKTLAIDQQFDVKYSPLSKMRCKENVPQFLCMTPWQMSIPSVIPSSCFPWSFFKYRFQAFSVVWTTQRIWKWTSSFQKSDKCSQYALQTLEAPRYMSFPMKWTNTCSRIYPRTARIGFYFIKTISTSSNNNRINPYQENLRNSQTLHTSKSAKVRRLYNTQPLTIICESWTFLAAIQFSRIWYQLDCLALTIDG